jgi:hypothetical protein
MARPLIFCWCFCFTTCGLHHHESIMPRCLDRAQSGLRVIRPKCELARPGTLVNGYATTQGLSTVDRFWGPLQ